ncbi:MAG: HAMP domain-containing protein, partial [Quisquiliibacterium sp.]
MPIRGLRARMVVLFLSCMVMASLFVTLVWFPRLQESSHAQVRAAVQDHLKTLGEAVTPFLLASDLAAIHALLPATLQANQGWLAFKLTDRNGRRLYPLGEPDARGLPPAHWVISQPIIFRGEKLADLDLITDFSEVFRAESRENTFLALVLISILVAVLLVLYIFFERSVRSPLQSLAHAATKLARGDYSAKLPGHRGDEVGDLIQDFLLMRDELRHQRDQIVDARNKLEERVLLRTQELELANEALSIESAERQRIEEQLRQSQKMEALGKLTGGVAHDFNNLMAVIGGHAELLRDQTGESASLTAIERAASRAARLTQQLLAFSRQQTLSPEPVNLQELTAGLLSLYQRTLGEQIEVTVRCDPEVWPVNVDAGQLDNSLLNLAINARDAMPRGGTLTIECHNVTFDSPRPR